MAAQVDGLLLVSPLMSDAALRELAEMTPLVVINRLLDGIPAVLTDAYEATGHAVEHLHALGHRRIVYLAGPDGYSNDVRLRGLPRGLRPARDRGRSSWAPSMPGSRPACAPPTSFSPRRRPAVVAYNDEVAVGRDQPARPIAASGYPTTSASSASTTPRSPRWSRPG